MSGEEYITQALLNVCEKCCVECIGDGHGISYCIDICGCNCDEFFDNIDCDPDEEDCEEEEYELDDICGEDSELDSLCHEEDEDEWW